MQQNEASYSQKSFSVRSMWGKWRTSKTNLLPICFGSSKVLKYFLYYCVLCRCGAAVLSPFGTAGVWGVRNIGFQMEVKYLTTIWSSSDNISVSN